ncbi:MAG: hypothetical protein ABSE44_03225 [Candidatus Sulfotelmatobacter sp.]
MNRALLILAAAVLFVNTLVTPTSVRADGAPTQTNCGNTLCKP